MKFASAWLKEPTCTLGGKGERAFMHAIDDASTIASEISEKKVKDLINNECDKLNFMKSNMHELIRQENVGTRLVLDFF